MPRFCTIVGDISTRLQNMNDLLATTTLNAIRDTMLPPLSRAAAAQVQREFPTVLIIRCTDSHRSNIAAEREETRSGSWIGTPASPSPSVFFRCGLHRGRSAEKGCQDLDGETESFLVNVGLSLRVPGAAAKIRERAVAWARARVRVLHGKPSPEVVRWRSNFVDLVFPEPAENMGMASLSRRFALETVFNGDLLSEEVQHYCGPTCCPGGLPDTYAKLDWALRVFFDPLPNIFPRLSWQGQAAACSHVLLLMGVHGLLLQSWGSVQDTARMRKQKVQRMLEQLGAAAVTQADGPKPSGGSDGTDRLRGVGLDREEAVARCEGVRSYMSRGDALQRVCLFRMAAGKFGDFKRALLERGASWENRTVASGSRRTAMAQAASLADPLLALQSVSAHVVRKETAEDNIVSRCAQGGDADSLATLRFRTWARAGANLYTMVFREQHVYPWRLFRLLDTDGDPGAIAA